MLGTPNRGSHAITELLVGRVGAAPQAGAARHPQQPDGPAAHHRAVSRRAGDAAGRRRTTTTTSPTARGARITRARAAPTGRCPTASDLQAAADVRRALDSSPIDPEHMIYVAGSADVTIAGMKLAYDPWRKRDRIEFVGTTRGDGRVTWDSGIPPSVPDVVHGRGARRSRRASARVSGAPRAPHAGHDEAARPARARHPRGRRICFPMPPAEDDRFPDEDDLAAAVVGAGSRKRRTRAAAGARRWPSAWCTATSPSRGT